MSIVMCEDCEKNIDTDKEESKDIYFGHQYWWFCIPCYEEY